MNGWSMVFFCFLNLIFPNLYLVISESKEAIQEAWQKKNEEPNIHEDYLVNCEVNRKNLI